MGACKENYRRRKSIVAHTPLFGLCEKLFCNEKWEFALTLDFSDTYEIEFYNSDGVNNAGISVVKLQPGLYESVV